MQTKTIFMDLTSSLFVVLLVSGQLCEPYQRSLNDVLRVHAVLDCIVKFEAYVERSDIRGERISGTPPVYGLKIESVSLAHEYLSTMGETLRLQVIPNLARVSALTETLMQLHGKHKFLRLTMDEEERKDKDHEHIMKLALEYRRLRWLRVKGAPELNPLKDSGKLGQLIDLLVGCENDQINLDELVRSAELELEQEMRALTDISEESPQKSDYHALERIESVFSKLVVRVLAEMLSELTNLSTKPLKLTQLRRAFSDGVRNAGFSIEPCDKLRRIDDGWF